MKSDIIPIILALAVGCLSIGLIWAITELGLLGPLTSWAQRLAGPILLFVVGVILWVVAKEMAETEGRRKLQEGRNY